MKLIQPHLEMIIRNQADKKYPHRLTLRLANETVTSLCHDAGVTKVDMPKCEKRVQAIVVNAVIAHNSALACLNSPEKVKQFGLNEECGAFERDSKTVDEWQRAILSAPQK